MARFSLSLAAAGNLSGSVFFDAPYDTVEEFAQFLSYTDTVFMSGELVEITKVRESIVEKRWPMALRADIIESVLLVP